MEERTPLFSFGVIADIQYADIDNGTNFSKTRTRFYRSGLLLLRNALRSWSRSRSRPSFILQLGDIIDGFNRGLGSSDRALDAVLAEFSSEPLQVHHVWGNHEFYNFSRSQLMESRLNSSPRAGRCGADIYAYSFSPAPGFTFVLLDGYDVSLLGVDQTSEQYSRALKWIRKHNHNQDLNQPPAPCGVQQRFAMFNGGFSEQQLLWLDALLSRADEQRERVTVVCHLPVHPAAADPVCLPWNYEELLSTLRAHSSAVCFIAGHEHDGGYHWDPESAVHHLTLEGVIETPPDSDAFATVSVYEDRMVLKGNGRVADRELLFPR
ncbi:manganese-dependent ADP-ribose/CDP-alcohol diphosphatase [Genypterus blacodes]|uniref:manganese-dependent ADP-ribose/CDP-alcohol diphosphatase n=1 Tax=Genypterus blacodes TaxID=154954 RepID=UPI003F765F9D